MNTAHARPVTILTGFLGAGKTTFLNALMKSYPKKRFAIIENEIGQLNIDSSLLNENYGQLVALQEGCICCTLNNELYTVLESLYQKKDSFDELVIECTGLAVPDAITEPFTMHPMFKNYFPLKKIICLVDAALIEDQIKERDEVLRQITAADVIVINKTEAVHSAYLSYLSNYLAHVNPLAKTIQSTVTEGFPFEIIKEIKYTKKTEAFSFLKNVNLSSSLILGKSSLTKQHLSDIATRVYTFAEEFNFVNLFLGLSKLVGKYPNKIYRMKGIGYKKDEDKKIIIQTVGSRVDMDYGNHWKQDERKMNTLVFIGKELDSLSIQDLLIRMLTIKEKQ
ncbi:CobW family GTP-binding protein [Sphingobacterium siyangense]|uniref:CobW family GTP-binding protein n=1 Tax=Sphingobacterium siyangense TaxID=459529 RepID=UPI003DA5CFB7